MSSVSPGAHGEARLYAQGCRCDRCRAAVAQSVRERRHRNRASRVNGRAVGDVVHGTSGYTNYHCRCDVCREAHLEAMRGFAERRYAARELVDGRLVATAAERHGRPSTYRNHGCRCVPCTVAESAARVSRRAGACG